MNWHRIGLITSFDLQHSIIRLKGLIFLVPFFLFWFLILRKVDGNVIAWFQSAEGLVILSTWFDIEITRNLFILHPPVLSLFFIITLTTIPAFTVLAGSDQFSSDLGDGYFRFLTTRCKRAEIFVGRYLSTLILMLVGITIIGLITSVISIRIDQFPIADVLLYFLQIQLTLLLYTMPFIAYMSIISTLVKSPIGALLLGGSGYVFLVFFIFIVNTLYDDIEILSYILPSVLKPQLFGIDASASSIAVACLPIYLFVYAWLAWLIFKHRNF